MTKNCYRVEYKRSERGKLGRFDINLISFFQNRLCPLIFAACSMLSQRRSRPAYTNHVRFSDHKNVKLYNDASSTNSSTCEILQQILILINTAIVFSQSSSWPEDLSTGVAGKSDSFKMFDLNVVSDGHPLSFFSTHFANRSASSIWGDVLALLHQRFYLCIKFLNIARNKILNW